jgi:hypothetical protein
MPDYLPAYVDIFTDPAGLLWVVTAVPGDESTTIHAFAPDGEGVGDVVLPADVKVFEIGGDYILGIRFGEDGQETLLMYRYSLP